MKKLITLKTLLKAKTVKNRQTEETKRALRELTRRVTRMDMIEDGTGWTCGTLTGEPFLYMHDIRETAALNSCF